MATSGKNPARLTGAQRRDRAAAARRRAARRKCTRIGLFVAGLAALAVVAVIAFRPGGTGKAVITPTGFSLPALNGSGYVKLADYRGQPTVVNFVASWCTACDSELPGFTAEADALEGKVTFIGVDSLETGDKNHVPDRHHLAGSFTALARDVGGAGWRPCTRARPVAR